MRAGRYFRSRWEKSGWEDYLLLKRHLARGRVIVDLEWHNKVSGPKRVSNVIAEIPGGTLPREWVILGAHLDSWDLGTGAQDNGTGVVMVLEAARAIAPWAVAAPHDSICAVGARRNRGPWLGDVHQETRSRAA
jgi:hypothetical protein